MSINSIEHITQKHFRSGLCIFTDITAIAAAALSCCIAVMDGLSVIPTAFAGFLALSALFSAVSLISARAGCVLMRISISVNAIVCFFSGIGAFTIGYLFIRQHGAQERINDLLSGMGMNTIATPPEVTGLILYAGAVLMYLAFGCAFFGHRFLGGARSCASGALKRSGVRIFPILSIILFVFSLGGVVALLMLSGSRFLECVLSDTFSTLCGALGILLLLHLLLSGISAAAFGRRTFAYKLFEKQIMKVETNADGTVYVPINEDREPDEDEPLLPAKKQNASPDKAKGKSYILEYTPAVEEAAEHRAFGEGDIL